MQNPANKKVLITGSRGMVGGNVADYARQSGWNILTPSKNELDLRDSNSVANFLADRKIDAIIHCAAKVGGIAANISAPADFIVENIKIDSSIISSARALGITDLIYFASSCMYPRDTTQPMKVEQILSSALEPTNESYALSKIVGTKSVNAIAAQDRLNWRVLIPSNLYGPRDNFDAEKSHLVPAVIRKTHDAIRNNLDTIEIWGDGKARREFTYVGDVAKFVVENFHNLQEWPLTMNIGNGHDFSINDYYRTIGRAMSFSGNFVHDSSRPVGMKQKLLDSTIAKAHGWNPQTDLESGVQKTITWYMESVVNE